MADSISFDSSELDALAADISAAPGNARPFIRKAVQVTAGKIRTSWQGKLSGSTSLPHLGRAITFEVTSDHSSTAAIEGEIGPEKGRRQAAFAAFNEFGTSTSPGRGYGLRALEENAADFEQGLLIALRDAERRSGL